MSKWYGKIMFQNEGILNYIETDSIDKALAFINGFNAAKEITREDDEDGLEEYWTCVDQVEPVDE